MKFKKLTAIAIAAALAMTSGIMTAFAAEPLAETDFSPPITESMFAADVVEGYYPENSIRLWTSEKEFLDTDEETLVYFYAEPPVYWYDETGGRRFSLLTSKITLYNADTDEPVADLVDTGQYAKDGDDIMGDGVYSCKFEIDNSAAAVLKYYTKFSGVWSNTANITVVKSLTETDFAEMAAADEEIGKFLQSTEYSEMSYDERVAAMDSLLTNLAENGTEEFPYPLIKNITFNDDTFTFEYLFGLITSIAIEQDTFEYIASDGEVTITKYNGKNERVVIPEVIDGNPVTAIGEKSFQNNNIITEVVFPDTIKSIGNYAFSSCDNLAEVKLSESLTEIGGCAFIYCENLKTITIPGSVTEIGRSAFSYCENLKTITIPGSVKVVDAFSYSGLQSVTLSEGVEIIEEGAFYGCENLTEVNLPESLVSIGYVAFMDCSSLAEIILPNNPDLVIDEYALGYYEYMEGCIVEYLPNPYFRIYGYKDSAAEKYAVENEFKFFTPEVISDFEYTVTSDGEVTITGYTGVGGNLILPSEIEDLPVTAIGAGAFADCTVLDSIIIRADVEVIGDNAFENCTNLTYVDMSNRVTKIGNSAFKGCSNLTEVDLSDDLTEIGEQAFAGCNLMGKVTVPSGVKTVPNEIFAGNKYLEEIVFEEGVENIGVVISSSNIERVTIPKSVTSIDENAFAGCKYLRIYGYGGTVGEDYAKENDFLFSAITVITFDAGGGIFNYYDGTETLSIKSYSDFPMPTMYAPEYKWHTFLGYFDENDLMYYDKNCKKLRDWNKMYDTTLTAKWEEYEFKITDLVGVSKIVLGVEKSYSENFDLNSDGVINSVDISIVRNLILSTERDFV
ncbi:MAG: leucine-rich repeat protein [Ruminococcus sp.]|jgi:hypothetical protein|nr:leucine-rich repeat protein [Ruminococcus sp.]